MPTNICVLYNANLEYADHLLLFWPFVATIWTHFVGSFLVRVSYSLSEAWSSWALQGSTKLNQLGLLLVWAIYWVIWTEHNNRIFSYIALNVFVVICKIDLLLIA